MSDEDDDDEEWLREAEMLQRERLGRSTAAGSAMAPSSSSANDDDESQALERAIAASIIHQNFSGAGVGRAWAIQTDAVVGRRLYATRSLSPDTIVFTESPLVVGEPTSSTAAEDGRRRGCGDVLGSRAASSSDSEMGACALALLRLPCGSLAYAAARLLQSPAIDPDGRSARWLQKAAEKMAASAALLDDDGLDELGVAPFRWALGLAMVNAHGAASPARGVMGILASMMEVRLEWTR